MRPLVGADERGICLIVSAGRPRNQLGLAVGRGSIQRKLDGVFEGHMTLIHRGRAERYARPVLDRD